MICSCGHLSDDLEDFFQIHFIAANYFFGIIRQFSDIRYFILLCLSSRIPELLSVGKRKLPPGGKPRAGGITHPAPIHVSTEIPVAEHSPKTKCLALK